MIDKIVYAQHMALLETWFVTDLTDMESIALYEALSESLTTKEFAGACKYFFRETDKGYPGKFPCARKFIDATHGDQKARALKLWSRLLANVRASKGNEFERMSTEVIRDAIAAIGGIQVIVNTPDQDLKWIKKDFIEALLAFKALETRQNYLPSSPNKSQLPPTDQD